MGARFGSYSGAGGISVTYESRQAGVVRLTDEITGKFRGGAFTRALFDVNETVAVNIQNAMVKSLHKSVLETGRHQATTLYLEKALAHNDFREVYAQSFLVGKESFLDRSPARLYWRQIEYGYNKTITARILFTNDRGGRLYGPWSPNGVSGPGSRDMPPGYKHAFMPQGRGPEVAGIGPWPAYHYKEAGVAAFRRTGMRTKYKDALAAIGITMTQVAAKP